MNRFSFIDLWKMYKSKGFILPIKYLLECWWFDISRGVSTHHRMQTNEFLKDEIQKKHSVLYMSSWTSVIRNSTNYALLKLSKVSADPPVLVDVGSGKGKVLLTWIEDKNISSKIRDIIGVEFSTKLCEICNDNLRLFKQKSLTPKVLCCDILDSDIMSAPSPYIIYMYNPFDKEIMKKFIIKLLQDFSDSRHFVIVYNNPVHHNTLIESGLKLIHSSDHWHANGRVNYYSCSVMTND